MSDSSPPLKRQKICDKQPSSHSLFDNSQHAMTEQNHSVSSSIVSKELQYQNEFSRLIGTIGEEALKRLQASKILLLGLKGLGLEIAKNIMLMGVASLTIHDPEPIQMADLSSNFYLSEKDVGKPRAECLYKKLRELNERVALSVHNGELNESFIKEFRVVCVTNASSCSELIRINDICHEHNIQFISGDTYGLFGYVFDDFGMGTEVDNEGKKLGFKVLDVDGEQPKTCYIESITKDVNGIVTVVESSRHDLEDGNVVRITEVQGMTEVNGKEFKIQVKGPYSFAIGDTSSYSPYIKGGFVEQIKQPCYIQFQMLKEFLGKKIPDKKYLLTDYSKVDRPDTYLIFVESILEFREKHKRLPNPWSDNDADEIVSIAKCLKTHGDSGVRLDEKILRLLAKTAAGDLSPMAASFGGIIAQEIIKAVSAKYTPINQWLFFDSLECLPKEGLNPDDVKLIGTRYDGQIAVFGNKFNEKLLNLRYFLVGAGAIGCELLKNWAMMGIGCGPRGLVNVTDNDTIEVSNLNRQFLYRPWDVSKFKSNTAAEAVQKMNPAMKVKAWTIKVGPDTEDILDDDFWNELDGVANALDNVQARLYMDGRCIFYRKPLLESGTLGTKGNVQVIVPFVTESYGSSQDPPAKETPLCLLHSFPNNIEHCLQWAREVFFEGHFVKDPEIVNNYLEKPDYLNGLPPSLKLSTLESLERCLINREKTLDECIAWARIEFEKKFNHSVKQLLHNFPLDYVDSNGTPFWSGAKRPPKPIEFDPNNELHLDFIVAATFLRAYTLGIIKDEHKPADLPAKREYIRKVAASVKVPEFVPKKVKITTDERVTKEPDRDLTTEDDMKMEEIMKRLPHPSKVPFRMNKIEFEKDDDTNFHIDVIHAAANLRATAYGIKTVERLQSKLIAGRIIPAIVTTTALVAGWVCLELYKIFQEGKKIDEYRNAFVNLALPLFQQSEPLPPIKKKYLDKEFTLWDRIDIKQGDLTLQEVLTFFEREHKLQVDMLGVGTSLIYASYSKEHKRRLHRKLSELVPEIMKKPLKPKQRYFNLEITASDLDGNDIPDLPTVVYWFK
jgi:ubiquitin-activating enzyme E1